MQDIEKQLAEKRAEVKRLEALLDEMRRKPKVTYLGAVYKSFIEDDYTSIDAGMAYVRSNGLVLGHDDKEYELSQAPVGFIAAFKVEDSRGIQYILYSTGYRYEYDKDQAVRDGEAAILMHLGSDLSLIKAGSLTKDDIGSLYLVVKSGAPEDYAEIGQTVKITRLISDGEFKARYGYDDTGIHNDTLLRRV
mgnify:CR=1 FL=1